VSTAEATVAVEANRFATAIADALNSQFRFAGLFAMPENRDTRLIAAIAGGGRLSVITTTLSEGTSSYPSVTALVPAADWYEREIHDLYGVEAIGHPDLDPLVLPLPVGTSPPRPGSDENLPLLMPDRAPLPALVSGEGMFTIPYGPVRSGVFEAIEYVVETPGEDIPRVQTRVHYKHRGVDVAFIGRSIEDATLLAERVEGVSSVAHAMAFCQAIERIGASDVLPGAQLVRVLHAELERIASHLDSTIRHTEAAGQAVALARFTVHKERVMRLRARLCGSRFGRGVVVPGGVSGPPLIGRSEIVLALGILERDLRADLKLLMVTPSFLDRLAGTGTLPRPIVTARGALGPLGRASGLDEDVRLSRPYGGYCELEVRSSSREGGDALARQIVRNEEMWASFHLIGQVADALGMLGDLSAVSRPAPIELGSGEAFGWAEAPQGEVLYLVRVRDGVLARVKPRSASFHNLALFTAAFPKDITTDFAFIEASFGVSVAGIAG
jgi:Ni,Fe-hydrogenase III large subunit